MGKSTLQHKAQIQKILHEYRKRLREYKERNKNYRELNKRIAAKEKTLKRLEKKEKEVVTFARKVEDYFGVQIYRNSSSTVKNIVLARYIFFKMGLEMGLGGSALAWYTGSKPRYPWTKRVDFQKSMRTNQKYKEAWNKFRAWFKIHSDDTRETHLQDRQLPQRGASKQQTQSEILEAGGDSA